MVARPTDDQEEAGSASRRVSNITSRDLIKKYFSKATQAILHIREGHLSVSGERMCILLINHLED